MSADTQLDWHGDHGTSLSRNALLRTHAFILAVHAEPDVDSLRRAIPKFASDLVSSDRANFNEFDISGRKNFVVPSPVPAYWTRLSPILFEYMHEHALGNPVKGPPLHHALTFSDRRHDPQWRKSALYHDYYIPAGARHQLFTHVMQFGSVRFSLAFNRSSWDFNAEDRLILSLVSPHLSLAWRNRVELAGAQSKWGGDARSHVLDVDRVSHKLLVLPEDARVLLNGVFAQRTRVGGLLPDLLRRWLQAQEERMMDPSVAPSRPVPFHYSCAKGEIEVCVIQTGPEVLKLLMIQGGANPRVVDNALEKLTKREREVLRWVAEGKRNREIATILGLSARTVGKHLERMFEKLGVETRSAAARLDFENRR